MWTTKKELANALKLSVQAKNEKFLATVELGPSTRGAGIFKDQQAADPLTGICRALNDFKEADEWFGKGVMRTRCGSYQTAFYFKDDLAENIVVAYADFKSAVGALDGREVELIIENGTLFLWQGKDYIRVPGVTLSEEMKAAQSNFELNPDQAVERFLNYYELAGLAEILKQIVGLTDKTFGDKVDLLYLENRVRDNFEDLLVSCGGQFALGAARQSVERLGGLGIILLPSNVGRKIVAAAKLLNPSGVKMSLDNFTCALDFGRFEIRSRLMNGQYISPELAVPGNVRAVFEFSRPQLLAFAKKAKASGKSILFSYKCGEFKAAAGTLALQTAGALESGLRARPQDAEFAFQLHVSALVDVLRGAAAERINLMYAGENLPVYLTAGAVHYALVPVKKENENGTGK